ncbi:hypothetical protein F5972_28355 [Microbispora cellulosiformans]|uniref:Transposase DDE domain-containing protein n=1 Tax=Microbispora cellulosiformans TaxID=2614688 RepID=A0A5J5JXZ9_9ACTN|nr:transposase [Microbispora cellulosiformans]KAA9375275.1 hypothetical protein F5972_28355 [Microbispora cellulosiformans]
MFPATSCRPCPVRAQCTTSKRGSCQLTLRPQAFQQALDSARAEQTSKQWQDKYKIRAGVEGTIRQAIAVTLIGSVAVASAAVPDGVADATTAEQLVKQSGKSILIGLETTEESHCSKVKSTLK